MINWQNDQLTNSFIDEKQFKKLPINKYHLTETTFYQTTNRSFWTINKMTKWQIGQLKKMTNWPDDKMTNWPIGKRQNEKLTKWPIDKITCLQNNQSKQLLVNELGDRQKTSSQNDQLTK
jgi:hypothetical protein